MLTKKIDYATPSIQIKDGEYDLVFEREILSGPFVEMAIKYFQNVIYDGKKVRQLLFSKIYQNLFIDGVYDESCEHVYTYGVHRFIKWNSSQDKYVYTRDNNVIYGIQELKQENFCRYLRGVCFENTHIILSKYFPQNLFVSHYPLLKENSIRSAMIFMFGTEDSIQHSLQVYKGEDTISIMYHSAKHHHGGNYFEGMIASEEYCLPNLSDGAITSEEIQTVLSSLQVKLQDPVVLGIISNELNTFGTKIDIRKGIVQEENDSFSPKLFIDKSFDEIYALVSANKDDYFKLIREQFETAANINQTIEKGQAKILKPNNSQK